MGTSLLQLGWWSGDGVVAIDVEGFLSAALQVSAYVFSIVLELVEQDLVLDVWVI